MPREVKINPLDRIAELELLVADLARQLAAITAAARRAHDLPTRIARTKGEGATYPAEPASPGPSILPIVFLDVDNTGGMLTRSDTPQAFAFAPGGWIAEETNIVVHRQRSAAGERWVTLQLSTEAAARTYHFAKIENVGGITFGGSGNVRIHEGGAPTDLVVAYFTKLGKAAETLENEIWVRIEWYQDENGGNGRWEITNAACPEGA